MRACRRSLLVVGVLSLAANVLLLAAPLYMMQVFDRVLTSGSVETLLMLTIITAGALVLFGVFDMLRQIILARAAARLETKLGGPLLAASIANRATGDRAESQALRDLWQLRAFLSGPIVTTLFDLPLMPLYLFIIYLISPSLGSIAVVGAILLFAIAVLNQQVNKYQVREQGQRSMAALAVANDQIRNADAVQAMGMLPQCVGTWGHENAKAIRAMISSSNRSAPLAGISKILRLMLQIGLLGFGAYLVLQQELTAGMIFAAAILGARGLAPLEGAIAGWQALVQTREAYARVKAKLGAAADYSPRTALPNPKGELSVEQLVYTPAPGSKPVLRGLTFNIAAGESIGIVGPAGAGKSTLARLLVGTIQPSAGAVRLDGAELSNWNRDELGVHIGYLPQGVELFTGTVAKNIARLEKKAASEDVVAAAKRAEVHDLIVQLLDGYETLIDRDGYSLSGGQKQSVALARAFFGTPCMLVLDEPNAHLDPDGNIALQRAIRTAKQARITTVIVAQQPSVLINVDRIIVMRDGLIEMMGPRDQVFAKFVKAKPASAPAAVQQSDHLHLVQART
jgi:ATP-binding cassette subfamily C protein